MTPQLQQAIKLLQLSNVELAEFVEAELERNPLLQRDEGDQGASGESGDANREPSGEAGGEPGGQTDAGGEDARLDEVRLNQDAPNTAAEGAMDADYESLHPEASTPADSGSSGGSVDWSKAGSGGGSGDEFSAIDLAASAVTLSDVLSRQLAVTARDPIDRLIGAALIDHVDDDGYMRADLAEIADRLGAPLGQVEGVLLLMQAFEPTGVMARSLQECLALQLKERDRLDPAMQALLDNLELLAKHDYRKLSQVCGVSDEDVDDMVAELRTLTPKPGLSYGSDSIGAVEPDVFIREAPGGGWTVELNTDTLPRVLVDNRYFATVSGAARNDEEKTFITECHQTANWLVKSLDQRARTILKVSSEIVRQQDAFFAYGVTHLRPLNLKTVADAIGMHESTVSRVTSNKYMSTSRGLFELKYFFTAAIPAAGGGEAHSAEAVRYRIKHLIENETADEILSDDRLVEILRDEGVEIARRTVAKYREALRIPSSVQRRRMMRRAG